MSDSPINLASSLGKQNDFSSLRQETYLNLTRTQTLASAAFNRLFKSHGISQPLYNILRILRGHLQRESQQHTEHRGVPVLRIGQEMVTREPDITRLVNRLEKAGLAERKRCDEDRRVTYIRITAAGLELLDEIQPKAEAIHSSQFAGMSNEELRMLNDLLYRSGSALLETTHPQE